MTEETQTPTPDEDTGFRPVTEADTTPPAPPSEPTPAVQPEAPATVPDHDGAPVSAGDRVNFVWAGDLYHATVKAVTPMTPGGTPDTVDVDVSITIHSSWVHREAQA